MTTFEPEEEKRFFSNELVWNSDYEEYECGPELIWKGKPVAFDTYLEFVEFMASLTKDEAQSLGVWELEDEHTGETLMVSDDIFDEVNAITGYKKLTKEEMEKL